MSRPARIVLRLRDRAREERLRAAAFGGYECVSFGFTPRAASPAAEGAEG